MLKRENILGKRWSLDIKDYDEEGGTTAISVTVFFNGKRFEGSHGISFPYPSYPIEDQQELGRYIVRETFSCVFAN
jgi:hypothetical protein